MWHIKNSKNKEKLDIFMREVADKIFFMLLDISKQLERKTLTINQGEIDKWKESIFYHKSNKKLMFDFIYKSTSNNISFEELFTTILCKYSNDKILHFYQTYREQNDKVKNLDYNIDLVECGIEFKLMFVDFYYNKFFTSNTIWSALTGETYDRKQFHNNFKSENHDLLICPYCDIDTTISKSNNYIEHFLPKSKFPFLSMNALNLVSSCAACNNGEEGKGVNVKNPIISPFNKQIGDYLKFSIDEPNKKLELECLNIEGIENYIDLMRLKERYSEKRVYLFISFKIQSILEDLSFFKTDTKEIKSYIEMKCRTKGKEQLMIAVQNILSDVL